MKLNRYSIGTGDRFGQQGKAQLKAVQKTQEVHNLSITPVWNKSHREHEIIGTNPADVRGEADEATRELGWEDAYFVDADHITKDIVDPYISCSNFFTMDVADFIGRQPDPEEKQAFLDKNADLVGNVKISGLQEKFQVTRSFLSHWADQYLRAIRQAGRLYKYIINNKSAPAVFEISMDEVDTPQTPIELYVILKTAAEEGIAINTIAPKFTGDFYKGVDYVGDTQQFTKEFEQDILVIAQAVETFDLPADLKLSIHSGSDKFSLYPLIHTLLEKHKAGVHLKTSGTTWLEELIGLALSGSDGLKMVKKIYSDAYGRYDELTDPYKPVIKINRGELPDPEDFAHWSGKEIASKVEHNPESDDFDSQLRQFLHCSYKIATEQGPQFTTMLRDQEKFIGPRVTDNLFHRHIEPLFSPGD